MTSKIFSLKIILISLTFLKSICHQENITQKKSSIYLNYTSYFINSTIRSLSDKNFDTIISHQNGNNPYDYLILFTLKRCPNCNQMIRLAENTEKYYSKKNTNLKFYKVDSFSNHMTAMRFDIYKIPSFIYISKGYFAYFIPEEKTENELINFIENKNKEYHKYPEKIGYFGVCQKVVHNITLKIKNRIIFWNDYLTWIFLVVIILAFLYFEIKIYKIGCCDNKKKEKNENNKNNHKRKLNKINFQENKKEEEKKDINKNNLSNEKNRKKLKIN